MTNLDDASVSTNGSGTHPLTGEEALARLRERPENPHAFRGYGPLIALGILVVLMVLWAPTVAPEEIVLKPKETPTTTTTVPATTTTTAATAGGVAP